MKKRWIIAVLAGILVTGGVSGCGIAGYDITLETDGLTRKNVFSVNGEKCSQKEAKLYLCNYKNLYGNAYGVDLWNYDFGDASLEDYIKDVTIDELSRIYCMEQIARQQGVSLTADEKKISAQAAEQYFGSLTKEEISYMGIKQDELEEYYNRYGLARKLYREMTEGMTEEVSDDEARVIRINQIFVTSKENAKAVKAKLHAGEDFTTVANFYNEAGEIEVTVARGQLPEAVEEVAFDLENEAVSGEIQTEEGYYFIECVNKFEEELTEQNKSVILVQREQQRYEEAYSSFVAEAECKLNEKIWDTVSVTDLKKEITTDSFFSTYEELAE